MGDRDECLNNMLRDYENQSQNSQVNDTNFAAVVSDPCESDAVHLNEECDVDTGENTAQSNANMYSQTADKHFKCNICCKSFASKQSVTSHLYKHTTEKPWVVVFVGSHLLTNPFSFDIYIFITMKNLLNVIFAVRHFLGKTSHCTFTYSLQ